MRSRSTMKYLASGRYPETATKVEKGVIRKQAKKFLLVDGATSKPLPSFLYIIMQFQFNIYYTLFHCVANYNICILKQLIFQ